MTAPTPEELAACWAKDDGCGGDPEGVAYRAFLTGLRIGREMQRKEDAAELMDRAGRYRNNTSDPSIDMSPVRALERAAAAILAEGESS